MINHNMLKGLLFIFLGIFLIYITIKFPPKSEFGLLPTAKGIIAGILFISLGVYLIVMR
jgi:uncharacterized transporter YbjL